MTLRRPDRESQEWIPPQDSVKVFKAVLDDFPYPHTDFWGTDYYDDGDIREERLVFGVPREHQEGMAFYKLTSQGAKKYDTRPEFEGENPKCPFHDRETVLTKQFDLSDTDRLQFKCPECYLTRYRTHVSSLLNFKGGSNGS